ncbi:HAD family hydrolase [Labedaea rhizosphaerae]|uniref:HAD family hydrolase n=1 Tax=Labedaea rhizosphaerae TaxID=598644 RepID=UPI00105F6AC4|nr:HAD-IA family hydrolase [Labedaea rhizosphaerae]
MTAAKARALLAEARALLLDFDGPICSVFQGFPAHLVADQLRDLLAQGGYGALPDDVQNSSDPFDILTYAAKLGPDEADHVEVAFRAHEVEAVQLAEPTPGAHELIQAWRAIDRPLAIVSNNSAAAVEVYLKKFDLAHLVDWVSARSSSDSTLLKPSPHLLDVALRHLRIPATEAILLGDSATDVEAAQAIGACSIGYANRPAKRSMFIAMHADAIVESMIDIV